MDFDTIKQYTHKIKKIHIKNTNRYSLRSRIVLKVSMNIKDTETVRFSLKENSEFIGHQQKDNDFFIRVPNNLVGYDGKPTITTIYAHFFDKDLYQYEEHQQIFSEFDFSQLQTTSQSNYKLTTDTNTKTAIVRSLLNNSIDRYKNPNYKQYTQSNIEDTIIQGYLPISSHYRSNNIYNKAPSLLNQGSEQWMASNTQYPYWEAKIHREDLSPLISDGVENTIEDTPLNVFLNYNYLPTSSEYHQHFFGFEDELSYNQKYYNILEGENLDIVSDKFTHDNYHIVQLSNVYNDKYSMYVPKGNTIDIDLSTFIPQRCQLKYNQCYKYYTYKPISNNSYASKTIQLKAGSIYTLKYYIYIPDTMLDTEDVYMAVNHEKPLKTFREQDKILREQWVYHEVPFVSQGIDTIYIIGPKTIEDDNVCHIVEVSIDEMNEYSPTIKYSQKGIHLLEGSEYTFRPTDNNVESNDNTENTFSKNWTPKELPLIQKHVHFIFDKNKNIYYNRTNRSLYYTHDTDDDFYIKYQSNGDLIITKDDDMDLYVDDDKNLIASYETNMIFTKSIGNHFSVLLRDEKGNHVNSGTVEAAIHDSVMSVKDNLNTALKYLGEKNVIDSKIEFNNIDLSNLPLIDDTDTIYYLHLKYTNPCNDTTFTYEAIILQDPQYTLTPMSRNVNIDTSKVFKISENKQLPLQIQCKVTNQIKDIVTSGYVDLSIDDHEVQSTIVDVNGIADFYLDLDDLKYGNQTIKLEYFTKYYHPVKYIYFKVNNLIKNKPTLPFVVKGIIQEDKTLPINITEYEHELQTITDTQTYDLDFNPMFMNIDIDIPSGVLNHTIVLKIYRDNVLIHTYNIDHIPTEPLIFVDDFNDLNTEEVKYWSKKSSKIAATYKVVLDENEDYRYNDVNIHVTHY